MSEKFDPYHKWLGIPAQEQPPHHYRLLAIPLFEEDGDVISNAADRQMAHLRTFQSGAHSADSQRLLNEASAARKCLLTPSEKAAYDLQLKQKLQPAPAPAAKAVPRKESPSKVVRAQPASPEQEAGFEFELEPPASGTSAIHGSGKASSKGRASLSSVKKTGSVKAKPAKGRSPVGLLVGGGVLLVGLIVAVAVALSSGKPSSQEIAKKPARTQPKVTTLNQTPPPLTERTFNPKVQPSSSHGESTPATTPALTRTVNLLDQIDHQRDQLAGNWKRMGKELIAPSASFARLELPTAFPATYLLTLVASWPAEEANLCVGLTVGTRQVMLKIDQGASKITGLDLVDGKPADQNSTNSRGPFLKPATPNTIQCAVSSDGVRAYCNGREIVHWKGNQQQLSLTDKWATRDRHHGFIGSSNSSFRVHQLEVGPLPSNFKPAVIPDFPALADGPPKSFLSPESLAASFSRGEEIDLLKAIDSKRDALNGIWKIDDGAIVTPFMQFAKLQIPQKMPPKYELVVVAQRISGSEALNLGISVGGRAAIVLLDGQGGQSSGLDEIEHKRFNNNKTNYRKPLFADRKPHELICSVTEKSVKVTCDGQPIFDWEGNPKQLTLMHQLQWPEPTCLCLGSHDASYKISRVVLRPISSASKLADKIIPGSPTTKEISKTQPKLAGMRWAIPTETEISTALQEIKLKHADLYAEASRSEGKLPLAEKLMQQARRRQESPAVQYVLLTEVSELAADVADVKLARDASRLLADQFEVDGKMIEASALAACVRGVKTNSQRHDLTMECIAALSEATAQDHYLAAVEFANVAFSASAKSDDLELKKLARAHRDHLRAVLTAWEKVAPAAQTLASNPQDAAANLEVGRFRCFWQADWKRGLQQLILGTDPILRSLASADLKDPDKSADQLRLGDDWWEYGERQPMPSRLIVQDRAAFWYTLGLTVEVTGTQRTRIETRLAKFKTLRDTAGPLFAKAAHPADAVMFGKHWYKMFTDRLSWEDAKTECEKLGGYLVCIESPEENLFVKSLAIGTDNNPRRRIPYWLGASDAEQERLFRWVNGSESFYADWKQGEPNNTGGNEDYVGIMLTNFGNDIVTPERMKWNDYAARERFCYVCEWDR